MDLFTTAFLSGLFAALVAIAVTRAIEYFGGSIGGVIATLPTTIIPASFGIVTRIDGDTDKLNRAMFTVPVGMLVSAIFLFQWRYWPKRLNPSYSFRTKLLMMISISLGIWLFLATVVVTIEMYVLSTVRSIIIFGSLAYVCIGIVGILVCFRPLDAPAGSNRVGWKILLVRGIFSGLAIFITVAISSLNSIAAGIGSAFPAIFLTIMVSLWVSQGDAVTTGAVGPMMLGGMSPPCYAMVFATIYPTVGLVGSIVLSWITAVVFISVPAAYFIKWRRNATKNSKGIELKEENDQITKDDEEKGEREKVLSTKDTVHSKEGSNIKDKNKNDDDNGEEEDERITLRSKPIDYRKKEGMNGNEEIGDSDGPYTVTEGRRKSLDENTDNQQLVRPPTTIVASVYVSEEGRGII